MRYKIVSQQVLHSVRGTLLLTTFIPLSTPLLGGFDEERITIITIKGGETIQQQYIEFKVTHQRLERTDDFFVVGETKNYLKARFSFSEDWGEEIPIIVFAGGGRPYGAKLVDGECEVPWEVLRCKSFLVSCIAGDRITTNAVVVPVCPTNAKDDLVPPSEPTPSVLDAKIAAAVEQWLKDNPIEDINLEAYATKEYVDEQINNSDYVTPEVLNDYATTEAMESYVTDQITSIGSTPPTDLEDYATKDYVDEVIANLPTGEKPVKLLYDKTIEQINNMSDVVEGLSKCNYIYFEIVVTNTDATSKNLYTFYLGDNLYLYSRSMNFNNASYISCSFVGELTKIGENFDEVKGYIGTGTINVSVSGSQRISSVRSLEAIGQHLVKNTDNVKLTFHNGQVVDKVTLRIWGC